MDYVSMIENGGPTGKQMWTKISNKNESEVNSCHGFEDDSLLSGGELSWSCPE